MSPFHAYELYPHVFNGNDDKQHGGPLYHELVSLALAYNIFLSGTLHTEIAKNGVKVENQRRKNVKISADCKGVNRSCHGYWGLSNVTKRSLQERNVLQDLDDLNPSFTGDSWRFGPFHGEPFEKSSFYTTVPFYPISFTLPPHAAKVSIQYVGKNVKREAVFFGITIGRFIYNYSTLIKGDWPHPVRIATWIHLSIPLELVSNSSSQVEISALEFNCTTKDFAALQIGSIHVDF